MSEDKKPVIRTDAPAPEGYEGEGFFATKLSSVIGMARKYSLWPLPFATSCCGIEFMATLNPTYDASRFGMERNSFSPRQADMLMVCGTISKKLMARFETSLYPNGRTKMGYCRWCLCFQRRYFRYLFCSSRD